jgi:hypothetical protein
VPTFLSSNRLLPNGQCVESRDQARLLDRATVSGPDVTNVSISFLISAFISEVLIQNVDANRTIMVAVRGLLKPTF